MKNNEIADFVKSGYILSGMGYVSNGDTENVEMDSHSAFFVENLSNDEIKKRLSQLLTLGIGVTEECNFRCKYCVYSGVYERERRHNLTVIDGDVAKKAILHVFNAANHASRLVKSKSFTVAFYGGEPLLCWDLIKELIAFSQENWFLLSVGRVVPIEFRIVTNGSLLQENIIDWCVSENIKIDISIDGPPEEHDRFRVYAHNGEGTFSRVMENINDIRRRYPEYFESKVNFQCTLHPGHRQSMIKKFFIQEFGGVDRVHFNAVNRRGLRPSVMNSWIEGRCEDQSVVLEETCCSLEEEGNVQVIAGKEMFTGTCFPGGTRVFVDAHGRFHVCEKIAPDFSIGSAENGYNLDAIRALWRSYQKAVATSQCWNCPVWAYCTECLAKAAQDGQVVLDCGGQKRRLIENINTWLEMKEKEEDERDRIHPVSDLPGYLDRL